METRLRDRIIIFILLIIFLFLLAYWYTPQNSSIHYATTPAVYVYEIPYFTNTIPSNLSEIIESYQCIGYIDNTSPTASNITSTDEPLGAEVYYSEDHPELIFVKYLKDIHVFSSQIVKCILLNFNNDLYISYDEWADAFHIDNKPNIPFNDFIPTDNIVSYRYAEYIPRISCESNSSQLSGSNIYVSPYYTDYLYVDMHTQKLLLVNTNSIDIPSSWWGV